MTTSDEVFGRLTRKGFVVGMELILQALVGSDTEAVPSHVEVMLQTKDKDGNDEEQVIPPPDRSANSRPLLPQFPLGKYCMFRLAGTDAAGETEFTDFGSEL